MFFVLKQEQGQEQHNSLQSNHRLNFWPCFYLKIPIRIPVEGFKLEVEERVTRKNSSLYKNKHF